MATRTDLIKLILSKRGNVSALARSYRVSRQAVLNWINEDPEAQQALKDARETALDNAEDALGNAVKNGDAWAVCFFLKTQGKGRGYVERQELSGKDGGPIETKTNVSVEIAKLTTEQIEQLIAIAESAQAQN